MEFIITYYKSLKNCKARKLGKKNWRNAGKN
jgi:hypothetical protein